MPVGGACHLAGHAVVGEDIVEHSGLAVEHVGVFAVADAEIFVAGILDDLDRVLLGVGVEVSQQQDVVIA